jgi:AcrR family transcriptional regulator
MAVTKRQQQKLQTKELLIQTAYEAFSVHGIKGTRMSDIAELASVSHGTVFLHFQSQEALIEDVVSIYGQKIAMRTHILADSSGNFKELLNAHLGHYGIRSILHAACY